MMCLVRIVAATLVVATFSLAQVSLNLGQPFTSPNQGNVGGGVYFDLTVTNTVTWNAIEYVASDVSPAGLSSFDMYVKVGSYVGHTGATAAWTLVASSVPVPINGGGDTTVFGVLQPAGANTGTVTFAPGDYGIALVAVGHSWGYQSNGQTFTNPDMEVTTGAATNVPFSGPTFSPRTMNGAVWYALGGTAMAFASTTPYGTGCYAGYQSYYEVFENPGTVPAAGGFDLGGGGVFMTFDPMNNRYHISCHNRPLRSPVGPAINYTANNSRFGHMLWPGVNRVGRDAIEPVTMVEIASNGYLYLESPATASSANASEAEFIAYEARVGCWHNLNVLGGGSVTRGYDPNMLNPQSGGFGAHVFTWSGVPSAGTSSPNSFQILIYVNGDIEMRFASAILTTGGANPALIGFTPGHNALQREIDLTASCPFSTDPSDVLPLKLSASSPPIIGTTMGLATEEPTSIGVGATFVALAPVVPPIDLGLLGAPGCFSHIDVSSSVVIATIVNPGGLTVSVPLPASPLLLGASIYGQSVWLDPAQNALGMLTSNGLELLIGSF